MITLRYGKSTIELPFATDHFEVIGAAESSQPLTDADIGQRIDSPVDSKPIEEIVRPGESVLIVVPDATRQTASAQIVNLLVRRLIANGTMPFDIRIIFATGIHRKVTAQEKQELVTPFIAQRIKMLDHNPRDLVQIVRFGETSNGIPIELNRALTEHDHTIIIGGINFHYFAGFTGGRKLICPGLASTRTISETHKLAFDCKNKTGRAGVGTGILDGNAVHEAFVEIVERQAPAFSIQTIVNQTGQAVEVFAGDWKTSHQKACEYYAAKHTIELKEKRDLVIVSCGGYPHDVNLIQAHKSLDAAARACTEGGTIIFIAECAGGIGRKDFLSWFEARGSAELAERLCENYQVNHQTAWALLTKAEKFNIRIITNLPKEETGRMRLQKSRHLENAFAGIDLKKGGYVLPFGAKFLIKV